MTANQIRERLLDDHAKLRVLIEDSRKGLRLVKGSVPVEIAAQLGHLAAALRAHNDREEAMLREVVKTVDAWGPVRVEIMNESHEKEHDDLLGALGVTASGDPAAVTKRVGAALDRLLAHMAHEETVLLDADVLRDDSVVIDYFGG